MILSHIIRLSLTAALLYVVWSNAHWSVALCLTILAIDLEINTFISLMDE